MHLTAGSRLQFDEVKASWKAIESYTRGTGAGGAVPQGLTQMIKNSIGRWVIRQEVEVCLRWVWEDGYFSSRRVPCNC